MPAGALVTVPLPVPALLTVRAKFFRVKVAVTVVAAATVTVQVLVPEQPPPLQPVKAEPAAGAAGTLTKVVVRSVPFHRITELDSKLLPFTVRTKLAEPATTLVGESEPAEGTGFTPPHTPLIAQDVAELRAAKSAPMSLPSVPAPL